MQRAIVPEGPGGVECAGNLRIRRDVDVGRGACPTAENHVVCARTEGPSHHGTSGDFDRRGGEIVRVGSCHDRSGGTRCRRRGWGGSRCRGRRWRRRGRGVTGRRATVTTACGEHREADDCNQVTGRQAHGSHTGQMVEYKKTRRRVISAPAKSDRRVTGSQGRRAAQDHPAELTRRRRRRARAAFQVAVSAISDARSDDPKWPRAWHSRTPGPRLPVSEARWSTLWVASTTGVRLALTAGWGPRDHLGAFLARSPALSRTARESCRRPPHGSRPPHCRGATCWHGGATSRDDGRPRTSLRWSAVFSPTANARRRASPRWSERCLGADSGRGVHERSGDHVVTRFPPGPLLLRSHVS